MISSTQTNQPFTGNAKESGEPALQDIFNNLRHCGLRNTRPRRDILAVLKNRSQPASIEQIHREIGEANCDLVTVYRTMAVFEDAGIVRRSFLHNGTMTYELSAGASPRYRVTCKVTHAI